MAKTLSPHRGKINLVLNIALTLLAVYLLYVFIGTYMQINAKNSTLSDQQEQLTIKTTEQAKLQSIYEGEFDDQYVEQVARENGFVNSDEKVYECIDE